MEICPRYRGGGFVRRWEMRRDQTFWWGFVKSGSNVIGRGGEVENRELGWSEAYQMDFYSVFFLWNFGSVQHERLLVRHFSCRATASFSLWNRCIRGALAGN